jgi:putative PIN family toxin of toxin-antitoxin system
MIVVIDTNILLVSISPRSSTHWLYKSFLNKKFQLVVSNEIILEYHEIIRRFMNPRVAEATTKAIVIASNTILISKWFSWNLIKNDQDDNKFVDAYIASAADYIVTEDAHFQILKTLPFPQIQVIRLQEFKELMKAIT